MLPIIKLLGEVFTLAVFFAAPVPTRHPDKHLKDSSGAH